MVDPLHSGSCATGTRACVCCARLVWVVQGAEPHVSRFDRGHMCGTRHTQDVVPGMVPIDRRRLRCFWGRRCGIITLLRLQQVSSKRRRQRRRRAACWRNNLRFWWRAATVSASGGWVAWAASSISGPLRHRRSEFGVMDQALAHYGPFLRGDVPRRLGGLSCAKRLRSSRGVTGH